MKKKIKDLTYDEMEQYCRDSQCDTCKLSYGIYCIKLIKNIPIANRYLITLTTRKSR